MNFFPWKGRGFGQSNDHNLPHRILLLGESHYGVREPYDGITCEVVREYIERGGSRFFTGMCRALLGPDTQCTPDIRASFYSALAFCNFIQAMLKDRTCRPSEEMWKCASEIFPSFLVRLKPSHIVVFGFELWDNLPNERFCSCPQLERAVLVHLPEQYQQDEWHQLRGWIGRYSHSGGTSLVMKVKHASAPGFSPGQWHPVLKWFLRLEE